MPDDPGIGSVRRLFIYALALVGAIFAAIGLAMIVSGAIDAVTAGTLLNEQRRGLAVALAFTVVGAPAWLLFMRLAQRSVAAHEVERRSQARRLYFAVARTVGLALVAWNAVLALRILLLVDPVAGGPFGALVAWGGLWLLHARLTAAEPAPTIMTRFIDRLAGAFAALLGLLMVLGGAIQLLAAPLSEAYDRVFRGSLLSAGWDRDLRSAIALLAVGGALWGSASGAFLAVDWALMTDIIPRASAGQIGRAHV